jgi:hypothetical protein
MKVINTCNECGEELSTSTRVRSNGDIEVSVDLCPTCVARAVQLAKENGWIEQNILRRGKIAA